MTNVFFEAADAFVRKRLRHHWTQNLQADSTNIEFPIEPLLAFQKNGGRTLKNNNTKHNAHMHPNKNFGLTAVRST